MRQQRDFLSQRLALFGDVESGDECAADVGPQQRRQNAQQGGFSRPVVPGEHEHRSPPELKRNVHERPPPAKAAGQLLCVNGELSHSAYRITYHHGPMRKLLLLAITAVACTSTPRPVTQAPE